MSSDDAEVVKQSDGAWLRTPCSVTSNGGAVQVRPQAHVQILDTAPALKSDKNPSRVNGSCSICALQDMESNPALQRLNYCADRSTENTISISMRAIGWKRAAWKCSQIRFLNGTNCIFGNSLGALRLLVMGSAFVNTDVWCVIEPTFRYRCKSSWR